MSEPHFLDEPAPMDIDALAAACVARVGTPGRPGIRICGTAALDRSGPSDLAFLDNDKYARQLPLTRAGACLVAEKHVAAVPPGTAALVTATPYIAFAKAALALFPEAARPQPVFGRAAGVSPDAHVHRTARLEADVTVDPGAVIGPGAEIGAGTVVAANAVIGPQVRIGRDCSIGANATVLFALVGDRVTIHSGVHVGQDGFGFAIGARHLKVPQIGRVIIQDDVEIGSGTTIDRGANRETVIGEGTKIDNLVQIAHNVTIGRHCLIVSQVGISGSTTIGDYVVLGGKVGVIGHVHIGARAQIAAGGNVIGDIPDGARYGGHIARPIREWLREVATLRRLARAGGERQVTSD